MKMNNKNFCVFIPSNGRAFEQRTLKMLEDGGYSGDWYIVCDDEDETLKDYKRNYRDKIIVFSKKEYMDKVDTIDNFKEKRSVVYARNAIFDIAREKGYEYFAMIDDDFMRLKFRFEENGKLGFKHVNDHDRLFQAVLNFQKSSGVNTVSFGMSFDFIGGLDSKFSEGYTRTAYCIYFFRTDARHKFIGTLAEDVNHSWISQETGEVVITLTSIQVDSKPTTETEGGFYDLYKSYEDSLKFMQVVYALIPRPDAVSMHYSRRGLIFKRNLKNMYPLIISEGWKK